ncbi:MAG: UDP-N-acetylglucosamine 2-epimerase (non-hydrolyzing) [Candidatus Aenigmarchaeota archaeon]|nr:UDP-N-acetylglucosamine 2-epimerase (non-hydrolyzing) [Candidatus Aenigmarchaeota archaeon]
MKLLFIFGTRPEAIKMAPLILKAKSDPSFDVKICVTGQHKEMLFQVLDFFDIKPDHNIDIMTHNQTLFDLTAGILQGLKPIFEQEKPDMVLVQGDTTTAFVGALASFYMQVPVIHIEAGLRSHNKLSPFPEEINRSLAGHLAKFHFAPTIMAKENLLREGINETSIHIVGNTVIDALLLTLTIIKENDEVYSRHFEWLDKAKRMILVTGHRRESFGEPFRNICRALIEIADTNNVEIVYPVHLNPNVKGPVFELLSNHKSIHLIDPLTYPYLVWLMNKASLILTDSGGIQEEAPTLGKPVLVMREVTERIEGIEAGTCKLVGTNYEDILNEANILLSDSNEYDKMAKSANPYGDGKASDMILRIIKETAS